MSIESVRQFSQIAKDDPEIQKSLETTIETKSLINIAVQVGSERGFNFTANEVEEYYKKEIGVKSVRETKVQREMMSSPLADPTQFNSPDPCSGLPYLAYRMCLTLLKKEKQS